jgi:hypothetical protein
MKSSLRLLCNLSVRWVLGISGVLVWCVERSACGLVFGFFGLAFGLIFGSVFGSVCGMPCKNVDVSRIDCFLSRISSVKHALCIFKASGSGSSTIELGRERDQPHSNALGHTPNLLRLPKHLRERILQLVATTVTGTGPDIMRIGDTFRLTPAFKFLSKQGLRVFEDEVKLLLSFRHLNAFIGLSRTPRQSLSDVLGKLHPHKIAQVERMTVVKPSPTDIGYHTYGGSVL